jgi:chemotaxis protein CheD
MPETKLATTPGTIPGNPARRKTPLRRGGNVEKECRMSRRTVIVKMAGMDVIKSTPDDPASLKTTLGSCVGVILTHRASGVHGLAHVMLPEQTRNDPAIGKYADTAIPELLKMMEHVGARCNGLAALVVGGANMFEFTEKLGAFLIGEKNVEAVKKVLSGLGVPVVFEETGGSSGRTVLYHGQPGECNGGFGADKSARNSARGFLEIKTLAQIRPVVNGKPSAGERTRRVG